MNRILYEVSFMGNIQSWLGIIWSIVILIVWLAIQTKNGKIEKNGRIAITLIMIAVMAIYTIAVVVGYVGKLIPYKNGRYIEIKGVVEGYSSNFGSTRGSIESFTLNGVKFECSDGAIWGYCPNRKNGGVIAGNGQHLRIRYIPDTQGNKIVYIEQMMPEEWNTD